MHRWLIGAMVLAATGTHGGHGWAQDATSPVGLSGQLAPTADPAATPTNPDLNGFGTSGNGLRGTDTTQPAGSVNGDGTGNPIDSATATQNPVSKDAARLRLRPTWKEPETSTAKERVGPPLLPTLVPYPRSIRTKPVGATIDTISPFDTPVVGPTVAVVPPPPPLRRATLDPTPFAPIGYTVGSLRLTPYVEQSLGFDSNPDQSATGIKPSGFSRTEGGFDLLSLWSSNELRASMHGAYNDFFSNPAANRPEAAGTVDYRYDVSRDIALDAEGRFAISTQRPGSPELNVQVKDRPLVSSYGTSLGGSDTLGRFTVALHGTFDRTQYENGVLPDGVIVPLNDENFNQYGVIGRVSYELTPALKPFVEVEGDTRIHDLTKDFSGYARDSDGIQARVGSTFEISRLITGQASAGYGDRTYQDRRLTDLRGPLIDASLIYAVTPLTTLTLAANTSFNETTVVGSPGTEARAVSLQVSHALLRNLTLTGIVSYLNTDYINSTIVENTISLTAKASYNITRSIVLDATYNHQTLDSTLPSSGYTQDVFLVGLKLQH